MELTAIPGVGKKTAEALAQLDDPMGAIDAGDVATIAQAPGISPGRAAMIVRGSIRDEHGDAGAFLATDRAQELYRELLELIQDRAVTDYGAHRLETFFPTAAESRITETREFVTTALARDPDSAIIDSLAGVEPLASPPPVTIRDRCIATGDAERAAQAQDRYPELSVEIVDDPRDISDLARGYTSVIVIDERFAGFDTVDAVEIRPDAFDVPVEIVPERTLAFFAENRDAIMAAIDVIDAANETVPTDIDALRDYLNQLTPDGTPKNDATLDRLSDAIDDFDVAISTAESVANDHLRHVIGERDLTIEGADLLSLVERGAGVDSLLEHELADEFSTAVDSARSHLIDALRLSDTEATLATDVFRDEPTFPVEHDAGAASRLRDELTAERDRRAASIKTELATALAAERAAVEELVSTALELDVELAISRFSRDFQCTMPEFGGNGIRIEAGRSPLLDEPPGAIDPVDYAVDDVVLLSGVNSGGKTSLLDLVAATTILAHMGFPVPAERVELERFSGINYYAATQGTLDAGAFEATLQQFASLVEVASDRLVLVDELESITEPGAAATIVAGILESLDGTTSIFVSHLAREIIDATDTDLRVDGIAAQGVEEGELVVDRSPVRDHLARSTPELIVESLETTADGETAAFYSRLLEKFE